MPYAKKLSFTKGGTITGQHPGQKIKAAIDEIQKKSITNLTSSAPGLGFEKKGNNTWQLVSKGSSGGGSLFRVHEPVGNDGAKGDAEIKYEGGQYVLYITFPRVNRSTQVTIQPES